MTGRGLILAAPSSGSGKTTVTLGLLRALRDRNVVVRGAKSGPDYIDPRFHEAASGAPCFNLDAWAMTPDRITSHASGHGLLLVEGAMGLYDGAPPDGRGATADLARILGLPVVLIVDAGRMSQSVAPLVAGFARHDPAVRIAGIILNNVGSPRHEAMLRRALAPLVIPVLGALPRNQSLALPARHLGLVGAGEHPELETFLSAAADCVAQALDLEALAALAVPFQTVAPPAPNPLKKRIAIARDAAFAFIYAQDIAFWQERGADLRFFSPLANEPVPEADWVYLPGGYPELHADTLSHADRFLTSLRQTHRFERIYGECGGYMVLGETITDAQGVEHPMAGLLALKTSFADRQRHLGYRRLRSHSEHLPGGYMAHEFHYATTIKAEGAPLFDAWDAEGNPLPPMGLMEDRVLGSFAHIIGEAPG